MFDSSIGYAGRVTIKIKNKPPIRKFNTGTKSLFNVLSDCLAKSNMENFNNFRLRLPWYMDILNANANSKQLTKNHLSKYSDKYDSNIGELDEKKLADYSILRAPMLISKSNNSSKKDENKDDNLGIVELYSMLNSSNIENTGSNNTSQLYICLIDGLQQNVLAFVGIEESVITALTGSVYGQAEIEWQLQLGNKGDIK